MDEFMAVARGAAAAGTSSGLGLQLERHLAVRVDLSVERLVVEGSGSIGLHEHLHVGFLDDLVAGLRAIRQRERQPAGAAVSRCDAQADLRRKPGPGGQIADSSDRLVGKRKHAELLTSDAWMDQMLVWCAAPWPPAAHLLRMSLSAGNRPRVIHHRVNSSPGPQHPCFPLPARGDQTSHSAKL